MTAVVRRLFEYMRRLEQVLLTQRLAPYGVAACRMLAATAYVGVLVANLPRRQILFGAGSDWIASYRDPHPVGAWVGLLDGVSPAVFTVVYLAVIAAGVAFALGWHTKPAGLLLLVGAYQIIEMNPLVGNQGDNILRIGVLFLLFTDCAGVWSFDAHRRARAPRRWAERVPAAVRRGVTSCGPSVFATLVHNLAVLALAAQVMLVYVASGMYKLQGDGWRYGTAIYYPLNLDEYRVFPFLNDLLTSLWPVVFLGTYIAVFLQLYFPVLLLHRASRRIALAGVVLLHLGIAVLMGLPWFSLAMVAFDGIFVSTTTYLALERYVLSRRRHTLDRLHSRLSRAPASTELADEQR